MVGPTIAEFVKAYKAKYAMKIPLTTAPGAMPAGLILQKAMEKAGSTETDKVKAAIDAEDMFTFYGHIKFSTPTPKAHGLQIGHQMIIIQWQKGPRVNPRRWRSFRRPLLPAKANSFLRVKILPKFLRRVQRVWRG